MTRSSCGTGWLLGACVLAASCGLSPVPSATTQPAAVRQALPSVAPAIQPGPGRPYDQAALLDELRNSARFKSPSLELGHGLDPALIEPRIAASIAEHLYSYDGRPYADLEIWGGCFDGDCHISVTGRPWFDAGADWYVWGFDPSTNAIIDGSGYAKLSGFPPQLNAQLDALARRLDAEGRLDTDGRLAGLAYAGAHWLPPPEFGHFDLEYNKSFDEEGVRLGVRVDLAEQRLIWIQSCQAC